MIDMAGKMDMSKKPHGAATAVPPRIIPGLGKVPFKPGEMILTPQEIRNRDVLGIPPDENIPEEMKRLIALTRAEARASLSEQPKGRPAGSRPDIVDISSLPEEKQRELREFAAMARKAQAKRVDVEKLIHPDMDPSVASAIRQAAGVKEGPEEVFGESVIDQLKAKVAAKAPKTEEGAEEEPAAEKTGVEGHCPRCKWDLSTKNPEPSADDKAVFFAAVVGDNRFVKDYPLFGGKVTVAFRSLSTSQGDLVLKQMAQDTQRGLVAERSDFMRRFWDYRLCLSILWISLDGDRTDVAESVDETGIGEDGDATPLPFILGKCQECKPLNNETVWRVVSQAYRHGFQALVDALELKANDPSF